MKKLVSKLISFQSDKNHPEEIRKCFDYIVKQLKKAGLKVKTYNRNNKPSLIAARKLKKHYRFILNGHIDVVPASYKDAFSPKVKNNRLYGRGTSDMKGAAAAMIQLIKDPDLKSVDVALMITSDEEVGGFDGTRYLVEDKKYSCRCVIVPDGGTNFRLVLAQKGVIFAKIKAEGKAAHGSRPWEGNNAIEKLITIFQEIKKILPETTTKNRWQPTVNLGKIKGGSATNVVPDYAEMFLDFRYPKKHQKRKIINILESLSKKNKKTSYKMLAKGEAMNTSKSNKYVQKIIEIAEKEKINLKMQKEHPASDGRFFSAKNIPVIMFAPKESRGHINNEWVDLKSLETYYRILKDFLLSF